MTDTITILGIAGSLRQNSFNAALLRAAAAAAPAGCTVDIASIRDIPLYDGDAEAAAGVPDVVETLKDRVAAADGLLLVTPEYNNSIPGVFKNAIDWLSRPPQDIPRVFGGRPVALMGATPGGMGICVRPRPPGCQCCASWACSPGLAHNSTCPAPTRCSMRREHSSMRRSGSGCGSI